MRNIVHGFTMGFDGQDHGQDTEEVTLPLPVPMTQEYRGGAMDLGVAMPMMALEAMEATVKMAGHSPAVLERMALAPHRKTRTTFRGAVLTESNGTFETHLCVIEGSINGGSRDTWQRGEKSGVEFVINGITYYRYEVGDRVVHEIQAYPPKRIINGVDQLAEVNSRLGYA